MTKRWQLFIVFIGVAWLSFNTFFLPFFPWSTGIVRTWLLLSGYLPYRDLTWLRTPLDLFLLGGWFKIFGISDFGYQIFIYTILLLTAGTIYVIGNKLFQNMGFIPFLIYVLFFSPLFQSAEMGEVIISFFAILLFGFILLYYDRKNYLYLFISGIICGMILITKQNSGVVVLAVGAILALDAYLKKSFKVLFKSFLFLIAGFSIPLLTLIFYYFFQKGLEDLIYYTIGVVLGDYRKESMPQGYPLGDGIWIEYAYISLLIPFLLFARKTGLSLQKIVFVVLLIIFLFFSLFPSYLSYRAITAFPIVSIIATYDIMIFQKLKKNYKIGKLILIISFILFFVFISRFLNSYFSTIKEEGFNFANLIKDYGSPEYKTALWIKENTREDEKIISITHPIVYFLSNRFPKNKYIDSNPNMLYPFEKTTRIFLEDPPRIVVFEENLTEQFPHYVRWPFYQYFRKNYILREKFGQLSIYELPQEQRKF